ncbi:anthranilate synthase component I family protein [Persephonella atlantica]|uniref:Anthranilate synthase component I family protein n=1 Tax=Persephonella atlantica TaxID=2699429 RepID=A0ABS1GGD6_9AQUI|nr:chorismate-binding protein [Persephonella atlantica]MBK3331896.1 anthranilate synthase component I family protein [Persephonella atlantica]
MEIKFFSQNDSWRLGEEQVVFRKPAGAAVFRNGMLYINGKSIKTDHPFIIIEKYIRKNHLYAAGFISYDYKKYIYRETVRKKSDLNIPHIFFAFFRGFNTGFRTGKRVKSSVKNLHIPVQKEDFVNMVKRAHRYIEQGEIYQINLSHRIQLEGFFDVDSIFLDLIDFQPAPYIMSIKTPYFSVVSGSMELFLEKKGRKITSVPIKGTRPTGKTEEETEKLKRELLSSEKERAENLMITDLMRNDIGKISERGSVTVENLFNVKSYRSVLQMGSTVSGTLKKGISLQEIVHSTFPPGSVTGAPKKRAIEIIDMLEKHRRDIYCGATVLIKPDLDFVMSVAIRQSVFVKNRCYIYVGSGIVADSNPEKEYEETLIKAVANLKATGLQFDIL